MSLLLMPKATAVWLVDNTMLSFLQIGGFCNLHELEVQAIADGEVAIGIVGLGPLANGQLTKEEIERREDLATTGVQLAWHECSHCMDPGYPKTNCRYMHFD